jgi:hypothetical protein
MPAQDRERVDEQAGAESLQNSIRHPLLDSWLAAYLDVPVLFARGYGHGYVE